MTFEVGDRVMIVYPENEKYHGAFGFIEKGYAERLCSSGVRMAGWMVNIDGEHFQCTARILRKVDDPGDPRQTVKWSDCPWKPKTLEHKR